MVDEYLSPEEKVKVKIISGLPSSAQKFVPRCGPVEWPSVCLIFANYIVWALATTVVYALMPVAGIILCALTIALFSSLQHEAIHEHPTRVAGINSALVFPALTLFIPYFRFRDQHLAHHQNGKLTDPYDDPESNYLDPVVWEQMPRVAKWLFRFNNTLLGRVLVGPLIGQCVFLAEDFKLALRGDRSVISAWFWHIPAMIMVMAWLSGIAHMSLFDYFFSAYLGLSIIKIRTFAEHRAHERASGRTAIVETRGIFALLFLNNNLHAVHHAYPQIAWYRLPALFAERRERFICQNHGYIFHSYKELLLPHFLVPKDPVPHPLNRRG